MIAQETFEFKPHKRLTQAELMIQACSGIGVTTAQLKKMEDLCLEYRRAKEQANRFLLKHGFHKQIVVTKLTPNNWLWKLVDVDKL